MMPIATISTGLFDRSVVCRFCGGLWKNCGHLWMLLVLMHALSNVGIEGHSGTVA